MKPTIRDVAKYADVSVSTVSRVINNHPWASEEAKKKVLAAISELGYEPNALARGLVNRKTNTIGIIIPDISNPFVSQIFRGMEDAVHQRNRNVVICNTDMDTDRMVRYLKLLHEKRVEGIIFTSEEVTEKHYQAFKTLDIPIVLTATDSKKYKLPAVKINDYEAARDAAQYLIDKGHTQIAMISGPVNDLIAGLPRYQGFQAAIADNQLELPQAYVQFGDYRFESGQRAMKQILDQAPEVTAVFAASDEMAIGAIVQATKLGRRVPEDLSVMGFDNVRLAEMFNPGLTTLAQPLYDMGKKSVELLFDLIDDQDVDKATRHGSTIYLPYQVIERESVSPRLT